MYCKLHERYRVEFWCVPEQRPGCGKCVLASPTTGAAAWEWCLMNDAPHYSEVKLKAQKLTSQLFQFLRTNPDLWPLLEQCHNTKLMLAAMGDDNTDVSGTGSQSLNVAAALWQLRGAATDHTSKLTAEAECQSETEVVVKMPSKDCGCSTSDMFKYSDKCVQIDTSAPPSTKSRKTQTYVTLGSDIAGSVGKKLTKGDDVPTRTPVNPWANQPQTQPQTRKSKKGSSSSQASPASAVSTPLEDVETANTMKFDGEAQASSPPKEDDVDAVCPPLPQPLSVSPSSIERAMEPSPPPAEAGPVSAPEFETRLDPVSQRVMDDLHAVRMEREQLQTSIRQTLRDKIEVDKKLSGEVPLSRAAERHALSIQQRQLDERLDTFKVSKQTLVESERIRETRHKMLQQITASMEPFPADQTTDSVAVKAWLQKLAAALNKELANQTMSSS